jgi:F0F1-type ATP synthase epsilon subunit
VAKLGPGELRVDFPPGEGPKDFGGGSRAYYVEGGFAHMVKNELTLLASKAIPAESLTESEAQAELSEAMARKTEGVTDRAVVERIRLDRERATAKLRAARRFKSGGSGI